MKQIKISKLHIENFKGCKKLEVAFGNKTLIYGANATGKTTIADAFMWLLFNKDSLGNTKFDIRPLEDGKMVDNVEISVEATISVDEEEYTLKKVQKQKWVKKHGTDERKFEGNVNEFEINGYPKSEREYKKFISDIVDEQKFNLMTNPNAFTSLPWKEQREVLMMFAKIIPDAELAEMSGEKFAVLIPELKIASTDDILKKYIKAKNTLNKQLIEIPARIDEVSKQLVTVDVGALEVEKTALQVQIKKIEDELSGRTSKLDEINEKCKQIMDLKLQLSDLQNKANTVYDEQLRYIHSLEAEYRETTREESDLDFEKSKYERSFSQAETERSRCLVDWDMEKEKTFPEYTELPPLEASSMKCPTCGQDLPEGVKNKRITDYEARVQANKAKYEKDKSEFESTRQKNIADINNRGNKAKADIEKYQKLIDETVKKINAVKQKGAELTAKISVAKGELAQIPDCADMTGNKEYEKITQRITDLENEIVEMSKDSAGRTELEARKEVALNSIRDIDMKIAASDNTKVQERIAELEAEKKNVGQKVAEQERMIALTEDFIRMKLDRISSSINSMFKKVSWKMFDNQINGGMKEVCECTVNGVPYSSLNNGHRTVAGLDIIHSLSKLYGVNCPVFIDNAEAISDGNMPDMDCQMILLNVTNDKELKVEVA